MFVMLNTFLNEKERNIASEIYRKYYSTMIYTAETILNDKEAAKDVVSESMIKIMKNLNKINDISGYKTRGYIVIIVRNTSFDYLKNKKTFVENAEDYLNDIPDSDFSTIDNLISEDNYNTMIKAIRSLPESMSNILYLSAVEDLDNKHISKMLNLNYNVVKERLSRAKKAIRKILKEADGVYDNKK